jgi:hypothetical protein
MGFFVFFCFFFARRIRVNTSRTNRFFKFFLDFDDAIAWPNDSDFQAIAYFNVQQLLSLVIFPHDRSIFFLALTGAQLYNTIHPATVPGCRFLTQMRCWTKRLVYSFVGEVYSLALYTIMAGQGIWQAGSAVCVMWKSPETGRNYRPSACCSQQSGNTIRKHLSPQSCG